MVEVEEGGDDDEDEDEDEEEEEGLEDLEDEAAMLHFEDGGDALSLVEKGNPGDALEHFRRLELEALADRRGRRGARSTRLLTRREEQGQAAVFGASVDDIWKASGSRGRRGAKEPRGRGRKKLPPGAARLPPEVTKKLGEANLLYASSKFEEAAELLTDVIRLAPNIPDSYHTLGLLYDAMGNRKKALSFYMLAAHLTPKDSSLWKRLAAWSMEEGNASQAIYCLKKVIRFDPEDMDARWDRALLYAELLDFERAARSFEQIQSLRPGDCEVVKMLARMYHRMGNSQKAIKVLDDFAKEHPQEVDLTAVNIMAELHMDNGDFENAIRLVERARESLCHDKLLPIDLNIKAGICYAYLGDLLRAETFFGALALDKMSEFGDLVADVADCYMAIKEPKRALHYLLLLLEAADQSSKPPLWLKVASCYLATGDADAAIQTYKQGAGCTSFYQQAMLLGVLSSFKVAQSWIFEGDFIKAMPANVEARLALSQLLVNSGKEEEAVAILSPPPQATAESAGAWWKEGGVRMKRAELQHKLGRMGPFLEIALPLVKEALEVELSRNREIKEHKRRFPGQRRLMPMHSVPSVREDRDDIFHGYQPSVPRSLTARVARKRKREEERKAAKERAGEANESPSEEEALPPTKPSPLPGLLQEEAPFQLLLKVCKALMAVGRAEDAERMVETCLQIGKGMGRKRRVQLKALQPSIKYETAEGEGRLGALQHVLLQKPHGAAAWNLYHQAVSSGSSRGKVGKPEKHHKFVQHVLGRVPDCIPALVLLAHHYAALGHFQTALRYYLKAYRLQPSQPLLSLCIGVALVNLVGTVRLLNRNQAVLQAFAFLYKYEQLTAKSQESQYNLGRAYHQLGLVHLAVPYYERALASRPPLELRTMLGSDGTVEGATTTSPATTGPGQPLPPEDAGPGQSPAPPVLDGSSCDLQREAAHNLALIYRASGASNLAVMLLQDYCTV
eukprot:SM000053S17477  [mRNA]  locus=s53:596285:603110:+ [translate_table: standard]